MCSVSRSNQGTAFSVCAGGDQRKTLSVFLYRSPLRFLRQGISLNLKLTICSQAAPGIHLFLLPVGLQTYKTISDLLHEC